MSIHRDNLIDKRLKKGNLRSLIDAKCISCSYDENDTGTWRQQVESCKVLSCPLYGRRAVSQAGKVKK